MSLGHGRHYLSIPGPSVMPDRVLQAMHQAAPNIYEGALYETVEGMLPDLRRVARTQGEVAFYICNGHGVWEAALTNALSRGDRILALNTGRFVALWADMAQKLGVEVDLLDFGKASPVDLDQVEAKLTAPEPTAEADKRSAPWWAWFGLGGGVAATAIAIAYVVSGSSV